MAKEGEPATRSIRPERALRHPEPLFDFLAAAAPGRELAWDCAAGRGASSLALARHFRRVIATEPDFRRAAVILRHARVDYRRGQASVPGLPPSSVDLVTVADALHRLDRNALYVEARRLLKPRGVIAAWRYGLPKVSSRLDEVLKAHRGDAAVKYPATGWGEGEFPFESVAAPRLALRAVWSLEQLLTHVATWAGDDRAGRDDDSDGLIAVRERLRSAWGITTRERLIEWPLHLRVGRVP